MRTAEQVMDDHRERLREWLLDPGNSCPLHEVDSEAERMLARDLAHTLAGIENALDHSGLRYEVSRSSTGFIKEFLER